MGPHRAGAPGARAPAADAPLGAGLLIAVVFAKILVFAVCEATGFIGGPILVSLFIGGTAGIAAHVLIPGLPEGLAFTAMFAALPGSLVAAPFSLILLGVITTQIGALQIAPVAVGRDPCLPRSLRLGSADGAGATAPQARLAVRPLVVGPSGTGRCPGAPSAARMKGRLPPRARAANSGPENRAGPCGVSRRGRPGSAPGQVPGA